MSMIIRVYVIDGEMVCYFLCFLVRFIGTTNIDGSFRTFN